MLLNFAVSFAVSKATLLIILKRFLLYKYTNLFIPIVFPIIARPQFAVHWAVGMDGLQQGPSTSAI
jgi:hypothetical protein